MESGGASVKEMQFNESVPLWPTFQTWPIVLNYTALLVQLVAFHLLCIKFLVFVAADVQSNHTFPFFFNLVYLKIFPARVGGICAVTALWLWLLESQSVAHTSRADTRCWTLSKTQIFNCHLLPPAASLLFKLSSWHSATRQWLRRKG